LVLSCLKTKAKASYGGHYSISAEELIVVKVIKVFDVVCFDGIEVDEESGEATVPVVDLKPVLSLVGLINLFVERVERNDLTEEVLQPGGKYVAFGLELRVF